MPNLLLRLEGAALFAASALLFATMGGDPVMFLGLLLAPDLFMLGYLHGPAAGSIGYNIGHTLAFPVALGLLAFAGGWAVGAQLALIWAAHIGMDRAVGYGFKYRSSFHDTHMQRV
jgi:hypothetical protein